MLISKHISSLACAGFVAFSLASPATSATTTSASESALLKAVNATRAAHGLRPLRADSTLARTARSHSAALVRRDVLTHGNFGARIAASGARGPVFGENLAWGTSGRAAARAIVRSWLASPGHRANLLRPGFRRIGVGAAFGTFAGRPGSTVVTADFAGA